MYQTFFASRQGGIIFGNNRMEYERTINLEKKYEEDCIRLLIKVNSVDYIYTFEM